MLSFYVKFEQTDGRTDRMTTVKQYAPDLSMRGHKKQLKNNVKKCFLNYHIALLCYCQRMLNCYSHFFQSPTVIVPYNFLKNKMKIT